MREAYETEMPSIRATSLRRLPLVARAIRSSLPISIEERRDASMASASGWTRYGIRSWSAAVLMRCLSVRCCQEKTRLVSAFDATAFAPSATNGKAQSVERLLGPGGVSLMLIRYHCRTSRES